MRLWQITGGMHSPYLGPDDTEDPAYWEPDLPEEHACEYCGEVGTAEEDGGDMIEIPAALEPHANSGWYCPIDYIEHWTQTATCEAEWMRWEARHVRRELRCVLCGETIGRKEPAHHRAWGTQHYGPGDEHDACWEGYESSMKERGVKIEYRPVERSVA